MKSFVLIGCMVTCSALTIGQIEELRGAHDQRKKYIDPSALVRKPLRKDSPSSYVNTFVGTGGHGHTYPGATAPFGMIQLSPDTRHDGWDGCSGYHYSDSIVYGFSHTHLSGTGVSDYNDLLVVPQSGKPKIDPGYLTENGYGARFEHKDEVARPGSYEVILDEGKINVRLAVSERAGIHEYTFNEQAGKKFILLDLDHRDRVISAGFETHDKQSISGFRISESWAREQHFYFYIKTNIPYEKARRIESKGRHKLLLIFPKDTEKVQLNVGISAVDQKGAKMNLEEEIPEGISYEMLAARATRQWDDELSRIQIQTKSRKIKRIFYTALYHSFIAPNLFSDVDGRYRGRDRAIHELNPEAWQNYTVFSLWDTYRTTHPLFTLIQQERTNQFAATFLRQFDQGGDLPVWELAGNETECMIGYHSVSVLTDAYNKGIQGYNSEKALASMLATSTFDEFGKRPFYKQGFIGIRDEPESVSKTLEYAYDDYCIASFIANYDNSREELMDYLRRSVNFVNLFDPETAFMRGRRSGMWLSPFDPSEVNVNYTEANSWQYSLYAPHAVGILRDLMGGPDSLENWLDRLFTTDMTLSGRHQVDITGLIGQYAHGNEPSHHMAYLYNYTNAPYKTQYYVDRILDEMYSDTPDGLSGNEDCGQMSSWYVLSAMGLYPLAPGNPTYEIGRPVIDLSILQLENGNRFIINVINNGEKNTYIQRIILNKVEIQRSFVHHEEIMKGGTLEIIMGDKPRMNEEYEHAPTLMELPEGFAPVPFMKASNRVFENSCEIDLGVVFDDRFDIHYTTDGSEPTGKSPTFEKPFTIAENTTIKAMSIGNGGQSSVVSNDFIQKDNSVTIKLFSEYANQYAAGGKYTLIDGIIGGNEYRTGDWQGYWAQDLVAEVSFTEPRELSEIGIGLLSDMKSWIFLPKEVVFEVSYDGTSFAERFVCKQTPEPEESMYPHRIQVNIPMGSTAPIHKIRITAKNHGKCPEWHLGNGNDTWIFADEILLH